MGKTGMRDSVILVEVYQKYFYEEFKFFKDLLTQGYNGCEFFLGARDNYLNVYYLGQSIAKIEIPYKNNARRYTKYTVAKYILHGEVDEAKENEEHIEDEKSYIPLNWDEYRKSFGDIINNAKKNALGIRGNVNGKPTATHKEKMCQQNIINCNNLDMSSDWYYVDMEYIDAGSPCGRVDMVAIKKCLNERGKHDVALIELKVGAAAYGCSIKDYSAKECIYDELRKNLYNTNYKKYKYGSGILSHLADYLRYLHDDRFKVQLRKELSAILLVHKAFGALQDDTLADLVENDFNEKPIVYILSCVDDTNTADKKKKIKNLKSTMFKYMYSDTRIDGSERAMEKMLNPEQIGGFIEKKDAFWNFIESDGEEIECIQKINDIDYSFIFKFWNSENHPDHPLNCLD